MRHKLALLFLIIVVQATTTFSQGLDASPAGVMISHAHPKAGWMFSYNYMDMVMKTNLKGTKVQSDASIWNNYIFAPQRMHMNMHMLMAMYGVTGRLSLMLMGAYLKTNMEVSLPPGTSLTHNHNGTSMTMADDSKHTHTTAGPGDTKCWALYKLLNGVGSSWVASLGLSLPTGKYDIDAGEHALYEGERHPYMMQLGTGTFDFMPGLTFLKKNKKVSWSVQALGTIRTSYNSFGYRYGNELNVNAWAAYQLAPFVSASLRLEGLSSGAIQGRDPKIYSIIEPDANPKNYGGEKASGCIGLNFYINKTLLRESKIGIEANIPFYQNLNGPQMATQRVINVTITKSF